MPTNWTIKLVEYRSLSTIVGWNLESPQPGAEPDAETGPEVRFRGWFLAPGGPGRIVVSQGGTMLADVPADVPRPDVARARVADPADRPAMQTCGFDLTLPRRLGPYRLEVFSAGADGAPDGDGAVMIFDILDQNGGPYAVVGRNRHLFLGGDTNDSVGQFTEERRLSDSSFVSWQANFAAMRGWETAGGLTMAFLIAPSKEEIFADFYPFSRARRTVLDDFRIRFADSGAVIPTNELRAQRTFAFCETDTHWTDYGATLAAKAVMKAWGMDDAVVDALPYEFCVRQRQGDLGIKLEPRRASYELTFAHSPDPYLMFDNGVRNQGCLRIWENPQAPVQRGCVIFGDSFGTNLAQSLTGVFSRVTYAYRPAGYDPVVVEMAQPGHVILQITQRFLHGSPDRRGTLFDTAANKIAALPPAERQEVTDQLASHVGGRFSAFAAAHLDRL